MSAAAANIGQYGATLILSIAFFRVICVVRARARACKKIALAPETVSIWELSLKFRPVSYWLIHNFANLIQFFGGKSREDLVDSYFHY